MDDVDLVYDYVRDFYWLRKNQPCLTAVVADSYSESQKEEEEHSVRPCHPCLWRLAARA